MPRLTPIHWKKLRCVFEKAGFKENRTIGSHIALVKPGISRPVIIPKYDEVGIDIIKSNIRTADISREEYFQFLGEC